jgi:hypothetical protein
VGYLITAAAFGQSLGVKGRCDVLGLLPAVHPLTAMPRGLVAPHQMSMSLNGFCGRHQQQRQEAG